MLERVFKNIEAIRGVNAHSSWFEVAAIGEKDVRVEQLKRFISLPSGPHATMHYYEVNYRVTDRLNKYHFASIMTWITAPKGTKLNDVHTELSEDKLRMRIAAEVVE